MPTAIKGEEFALEQIFSDDFSFSIPDYQRPYSWTREQTGDLLADLLAAKALRGRDGDVSPYFLGSLVLIKGDKPEAEVVDGQQRLTTLTILLAALAATLGETPFAKEVAKKVHAEGNVIKRRAPQPRLRLRDRDMPFFAEHIQRPGAFGDIAGVETESATQALLLDAARYFHGVLSETSQTEREELARFLLLHCYVVAVSTPDLDSAYRIFSVLNDRGMDLSPTDILKADVIGVLAAQDERTAREYTRRWEDLEEDLGPDRFLDLFRHLRMVERRAKLADTLLNEYREHIRPAEDPRGFIQNKLEPFARAFAEVNNHYLGDLPSGSARRRAEAHLRWLLRLADNDWLPPTLAYLVAHRSDPNAIATFLERFERLAYGLAIMRANVNRRISRYGRLLHEIANDTALDPGGAVELTPAEQRNILDILGGDIYESRALRSLITLRLDGALSDGTASYDYPVITIEHVLPQNPPADSEWTEWFADEETRAYWVHKLANLVPLAGRKNSSAQNFPFAEKKAAYFTGGGGSSPFVLTTQVLQVDEWTPGYLRERQRELLARLTDLWDLHGAAAREDGDAAGPEGAEPASAKTQSDFQADHARMSPALASQYERLLTFVQSLSPAVDVVETKGYLAFKLYWIGSQSALNFITVAIRPASDQLLVYCIAEPEDVPADIATQVRDVTGKGHTGSGDLELKLPARARFEAYTPVLRRAYERGDQRIRDYEASRKP